MLTDTIKSSIEDSVLCWLATADKEGFPNVSPKELFCAYQEDAVLIANIASPNSVANIKVNPKVCVSFLNIFKQKGYQLKGEALIIPNTGESFSNLYQYLPISECSQFPICDIIKVSIQSVKEIVAPSYWLFPGTTEQSQIKAALKTYRVDQLIHSKN